MVFVRAERKDVHADGKIHRAVHLYLFDTDKRIFFKSVVKAVIII